MSGGRNGARPFLPAAGVFSTQRSTDDAVSLGEKIGEGVTADIHVWAPGQIVKLFKIDVSPRFSRREVRVTRAAIAAGAPEVLDEVTVEGRFGIVLQRLEGPTLLQLFQTRAVTSEQVGTILANLYTSVHRTPVPPDVVSLRDWIDAASQTSRDILPEHIVPGVLTLIDRLPPEERLCHADLHPGDKPPHWLFSTATRESQAPI